MTHTEATNALICGHALLFVCAVLYLAWWSLFFRPGAQVTGWLHTVGVAAIIIAAVCGLGGLVVAGNAIAKLESGTPVGAIIAIGVIGYIVLLGVTRGVFGRQVTSELFLIVLWTTFEACVIASLKSSGILGTGATIALAIIVAVLCVISLVCYVLYYRLQPMPAFVDGMVPLIAVGCEAIVVIVLLLTA